MSSQLQSGVSGGAKTEMIALRDVHLTLGSLAGDVNILHGVDLSVMRGETVSVVGPSGSGKTSMLMIVAGLEQATAGQVVVGGQDFGALDEDGLARFRRDNLGIVFQNFHLVPTMTAVENVAIPLELAGRRDAAERAAAVLDQVGLGQRLRHYPGQLSGGEQQRVALARAFAAEPKLILADEPTGNLDADTGAQIVDLMFSLARDHDTTLMLITHDSTLAAACDRRVEMRDGRLTGGAALKAAE
ncbi:ABC transporter ATP-binding protein [Pacificispira sp.]|jgi:putative ABC transport system ATP-binding protein|uniref:ABC transporter ATP-binding protein n=1 Tax=Pacificispira sp. TaxID=2888761 RepID=UPI002EBAF935|nr:ATP-binding cassette domain-containing protein [Pseudomonadota bacterium]